MDFLRQQTAEAFDALLKRRPSSEEEEEETKSPELPPLPEDPEMDAAIEEMKDRLSNLRAKTTLQRMKKQREMDQLLTRHQAALQRARDSVSTVTQKLHMTPYLAATKLIHREEDMLPGVVVTLQAKLCLHIHAMCNHQEQLMLLKQDSNEVIYWYEDMVKQLRRDQADRELNLMNELVQAKILIGELVDAKKMRERRESAASNKRVMSRRFSRGINRTKSANSNVVSSLKQARLRGRMSNPQNIVRPRGRMSNPQNIPLRMSLPGTTGSSFRQRTVRQISTRGLGLQNKKASMRHLQKAESIRNMKNYLLNDNNNDESHNSLSETTLSPGVSPVSVRRVHQLPSNDINKTNDSAAQAPPSDDIAIRRAARAQARSAGRPIRRGVQRTRSRSLTDMQRGALRGSRRTGLSKDDENVSRRRISDSASKPLLVGFPSRRAQDDSHCMMKRKGSTRELLRGFSPAAPASPAVSHATSEDQEGSFTSTLKSWVGNVSVLLQPAVGPAVGISAQEHKLTLVG